MSVLVRVGVGLQHGGQTTASLYCRAAGLQHSEASAAASSLMFVVPCLKTVYYGVLSGSSAHSSSLTGAT